MKLQVYQSYWGMAGLPFNGDEEWSMEEKLEKIAEGGFDGVEFLMEEKAHRDAMVPLCDRLGLKRSNIVFPWTPEEFDDDIKAAQDGGASHINLQPMPMPRRVADGVSYIVRCRDRAAAAGYQLFFETHRDRMTTDMYFTLDLIEAAKAMPEGEEKDILVVKLANLMKRHFLTWNRNTVEDSVIAGELKAKSGGALTLPEGTELESQADILRSVRKTSDALARPHKKKKKRR